MFHVVPAPHTCGNSHYVAALQVDLMERYPEHRFAASSAQQYKWLEQVGPQPNGFIQSLSDML